MVEVKKVETFCVGDSYHCGHTLTFRTSVRDTEVAKTFWSGEIRLIGGSDTRQKSDWPKRISDELMKQLEKAKFIQKKEKS